MSAARTTLGGALALAIACSGGDHAGPIDGPGSDGPVGDVPTDALATDATATDADAPATDAPVGDAPTDALGIDAAPSSCVPLAAQPITAPESTQPWVTVPPIPGVAAFSLDTPVPLASLWFDADGYKEIEVFASCAAPAIAVGVYHHEQVDVVVTDWTDGTLTNLDAGSYRIEMIERFPSAFAPARLRVQGVIADGAACADPLVAAGVLACSPRANCAAGVCAVAACSNGLDDDGDGVADDADPGCALANDGDELDACGSGGPCPECADLVDSDGDGAVGWPTDRGCDRRGDPVEHACPDVDGVLEVTTAGPYSLAGLAANDHPGPLHCTHTRDDRTLHLAIPGRLTRLQFDIGQNPVAMTLYRDTCDTAPVRCLPGAPGQGSVVIFDVPAGDYWLVAAPFMTTAMSISGTLAAGAACDPLRPAFACPSGQACAPTGGGAHQCQ